MLKLVENDPIVCPIKTIYKVHNTLRPKLDLLPPIVTIQGNDLAFITWTKVSKSIATSWRFNCYFFSMGGEEMCLYYYEIYQCVMYAVGCLGYACNRDISWLLFSFEIAKYL